MVNDAQPPTTQQRIDSWQENTIELHLFVCEFSRFLPETPSREHFFGRGASKIVFLGLFYQLLLVG